MWYCIPPRHTSGKGIKSIWTILPGIKAVGGKDSLLGLSCAYHISGHYRMGHYQIDAIMHNEGILPHQHKLFCKRGSEVNSVVKSDNIDRKCGNPK